MLFFTTMMILCLFLIAIHLKKVPHLLKIVSKYSYGIYLFHMFVIVVLDKIALFLDLQLGYILIPVWFVVSVSASIIAIYILNHFPFGKYVLGKADIKQRNKSTIQGINLSEKRL